MPDFQYTSRHVTQLTWNCCQYLRLMFTFDETFWLPITDTELNLQHKWRKWTVKKTCVCGNHFCLREVKKLNFTPETTCNNRYIVKRTLIISEYSKHHHFNASQNTKLRIRIDLLMMLWLLRWIGPDVSWKCSSLCMWTQNFYSAEIHKQLSKYFHQQT